VDLWGLEGDYIWIKTTTTIDKGERSSFPPSVVAVSEPFSDKTEAYVAVKTEGEKAISNMNDRYRPPSYKEEGGKVIVEEATSYTKTTSYEWQVIDTGKTKSLEVENTGMLRDSEILQVTNAITYKTEIVSVLVVEKGLRNAIKGGCNND
jgi:hypothetical protein